MKTNLGHYREIVSEGDAESRETRSRMNRPKCESVKYRRPVKLATARMQREAHTE